jgi:titin
MNPLLSAISRYFRHSNRDPGRTSQDQPKALRRTIKPRLELLEDRALPSAYIVTTTAVSGPGSLRDAITQINADTSHTLYASPSNPSVDEIDFAITAASDTGGGFNATTGVATITPLSALPVVTNAVTIDGWSQPGFAGAPLIDLNGSQAGGWDGLGIQGGNTTVRGLVVNDFGGAAGVDFAGQGGDVLEGCYIGTAASGSVAQGNFFGVFIQNGSTTIGGPVTADRNVISGNSYGIVISGASARGNVVEGNYVGTDALGQTAVGNFQGIILNGGAQNNRIGTDGTGPADATQRNVISGNSGAGAVGIEIDGATTSGNIITGNFIGTDASGTVALTNTYVDINDNANGNFIGTEGVAGPIGSDTRNVISGHGFAGVAISGSANLVAGNYIGTDVTGTQALGNAYGVFLEGGSANQIGTSGRNATDTANANLISGNGFVDVWIDSASTNNVIAGDLIGPDVTGAKALSENFAGIALVHSSNSNLIGAASGGLSDLVDRNVISGHNNFGIYSDGAAGNTIAGNLVGTNSTGLHSLGNGTDIAISNGGGTQIDQNLISAGTGVGIWFSGPAATGNTATGNLIGTDITGNAPLGNGWVGVYFSGGAHNNAIGGSSFGTGNTIAFNNSVGVYVSNDGGNVSYGNTILGNSIHDNGGPGIVLAAGANDDQPAPVLTGVTGSAVNPAISGTLTSVANTTFRIEFFANPLPSNVANTAGQTFLGSVNVTTDATGKATFTAPSLATIPATQGYLTATATVATTTNSGYSYGDTSQFSPYLHVAYFFGGFQAPLSQGLNFALNRVIPIRFTLTDLTGAAVTSLAAVNSIQVAPVNTDGSLGTAFAPASPGNTTLSVSGGTYSFNWSTRGLTAGSYAILLTLADGTVQKKVIQLTKSGNSAGLTTVSAGGTDAVPGGLLGGDIDLYVDNTNGNLTADELARIQDAVAAADAVTEPYGVAVTEVTDPTLADVTLNMDATSAVGGHADGVLGCTTDAGQITLINGWNFYASSDATQIGSDQYDFETVVTHELGHALGLGHSTDSTSVMYATLNTGTVNRTLTTADLNVADSDTTGACGLHAAVLPAPPVTVTTNLSATNFADQDAYFALLTNAGTSSGLAPDGLLQIPARDAVFADPLGDVGADFQPPPLAAEIAPSIFGGPALSETDEGLRTASAGHLVGQLDFRFDFIPAGGTLWIES